jgi:uncharacterized membrane protein
MGKLPTQRRKSMAKESNERLVAVMFENEHGAEEMLATLRDLEARDALKLNDVVVLTRGPKSESVFVAGGNTTAGAGSSLQKLNIAPDAEVQQTTDKRGRSVVKAGGIGLLVGALLGGPVGGLLVGGLIGALRDKGIDNKFVNQIKDGLKPDSSAILLLVESADAEQVLAAIRPLKGTVLHTTLSDEMDKTLRDALRNRE